MELYLYVYLYTIYICISIIIHIAFKHPKRNKNKDKGSYSFIGFLLSDDAYAMWICGNDDEIHSRHLYREIMMIIIIIIT